MALLHLQRQEEAYDVYQKGTKHFDIDIYIKMFGLSITSYILMVGAQVYIAAGRSVLPCRFLSFLLETTRRFITLKRETETHVVFFYGQV